MKNMEREILGFVGVLLMVCACLTDAQCTFPEDWRGSWYGNMVGDVEITETTISPKGDCHTRVGEKYVVVSQNRYGNTCYSCLAITPRHDNILQYKQSECSTTLDISNVCSIRGDANLHTLVREHGVPVPCPFQGPYTFSYDNNTGPCGSPRSSISACANTAQLKFHFKECPRVWGTLTQNLQFTCLAKWKNGGDYAFGKFTGNGFTTKNQKYRCLTFSSSGNGNVVNVAMSGDASCFGISDPSDGPISMTLDKDYLWPDTTCSFPPWLTRANWRDLPGYKHYQPIGTSGNKIHIKQGPGRHGHIHESTLRCIKIEQQEDTMWDIVSYTTHGCSSNYQCIRIKKLAADGSVLQIQKGRMVPALNGACSQEHMANATSYTIIANDTKVIKCPFEGHFTIKSSTDCNPVITSNCDNTGQIVLETCNAEQVGKLQCLASWSQDANTFIIVKKVTKDAANCYSYKDQGESYHLELDNQCNTNAQSILDDSVAYTLNKPTGPCEKDPLKSSYPTKQGHNTIETNVTDTASILLHHQILYILPIMTTWIFVSLQ